MSIATTQNITLVDKFIPRTVTNNILLVLTGVFITAVSAQVSIPAVPVPFTLQTLAVLVIGSTYGAIRGAATMAAYALFGALGLPIFAQSSSGVGVIIGATGGFILGFIFAAALAGRLAELNWSSHSLKMFVSFALSTLVIYGLGIPVLAMNAFGSDVLAAASYMLPYLLWDAVKAVVAAGLIPGAWLLLNKLQK